MMVKILTAVTCFVVMQFFDGSVGKNGQNLYDILKEIVGEEHQCPKQVCYNNGKRQCRCDKACAQYQDCCLDAAKVNSSESSQYQTCMQTIWTGTNNKGKAVMSVSQCPVSWKDEKTRNKCLGFDQNDVLQNIPVSSDRTRQIYRNQFCALCHGILKREMTFWKATFYCNSFLKFSRKLSLSSLLHRYVDSGDCVVEYVAGDEQHQRTCIPESPLYVNKCPKDYHGPLKHSCDAYLSPISFYISRHLYKVYRNIDCVKCDSTEIEDNVKYLLSMDCEYANEATVESYGLYLTLDFGSPFKSSSEVISETCPLCSNSGEVYIQNLRQCVPLFCPRRSAALHGECITYDRNTNVFILNLIYHVTSSVTDKIITENLQDIINRLHFRCGFFTIYSVEEPTIVHGSHVTSNESCSYVSTNVEIRHPSQFDFHHQQCAENYFFQTKHLRNFSLTFIDRNNHTSLCKVPGDTTTNFNVPFIRLPEDRLHDNMIRCPSIQVYQRNDSAFQNAIEHDVEYYIDEIVINATDVNVTENGDYICWELFKEYYDNVIKTRTIKELNSYTVIVSYVCMGISIAFLIVTLFHYCVVPNMVNNHSMILLHVVILMLMTHSVYITGVKSYPHTNLCWWVGVILHFLFLSLFFTMSLALLQISLQLRKMKRPNIQEHLCKTLVKFVLPGYILSALFIGTTLVLNTFVYKDVWYGGDVCFVTFPAALFYSFALPIALCVNFNLCVFASMTYWLCTMQFQNIAHINANRKYYWISIKLSFLTGASWIFGFINAFTRTEALTIVFEVTSSLQGLFLGVSLLSTKVVRRWYRSKFANNNQTSDEPRNVNK